MKAMNPKNGEGLTLLDAMGKFENGQKWWTIKEIASLLKLLGWIGSSPEQMRRGDVLPMIALALANDLFEVRFNKAIQENEFRILAIETPSHIA